MTERSPAPLVILSDGTGDTARKVLVAALRQFDRLKLATETVPGVLEPQALEDAFATAATRGALVVSTLVRPEMRELAARLALSHGVRHVDLLGPLLTGLGDLLDRRPVGVPNLLRRTDEQYFKRIEAIEYTVQADDGRDPRRILDADVVLVGPSRSGKTPLSTYLAHRGLKVANQPVMLEVPPPDALFDADPRRVVGLCLDADALVAIRTSRMAALPVGAARRYDDPALVQAELELTTSLCRENGWLVIDVTRRAIEETAGLVVAHLERTGILSPDDDVLAP